MTATDAFNTGLTKSLKIYRDYDGRTTELGDLHTDPVRNTIIFEPVNGADLGLCALFIAARAGAEPDKTARLSYQGNFYDAPRGKDGLVLAAEIAGHPVEPLPGGFVLKPRPSPETIRGAIEGDDLGALRTALQFGAWPDAAFANGHTGLSIAAGMGKDGMHFVKLLIEKSADVNKAADDGVTPLMRAAQSGNTDVARLLLDAGARNAAQDEAGKDAAAHASNPDMKNFLTGSYPAEAAERLKKAAEAREAALVEGATVTQRSVAPMARITFKKN